MTKLYTNTGKKVRVRWYDETKALMVWESHTGVKLISKPSYANTSRPCQYTGTGTAFFKLRKNRRAGIVHPNGTIEPDFESTPMQRYTAPPLKSVIKAIAKREALRRKAIEKLKASLTKAEIKALFTPECGSYLLRLDEVL